VRHARRPRPVIAPATLARTIGLAALIASVATTAAAQAPVGSTLAIVGGTVYPVAGPKIDNCTVLIRDGKIVALGNALAVPPGATQIDARGKWVTPGLINASSALGLVEVTGIAETRDFSAKGQLGVSAAFVSVDGLNPASEMIPPTRAGGVTSIVVRPIGGLVAGQAAFVDLTGGPASAMVVKTPVAMVAQISSPAQADANARGEVIGMLRSLFDEVRVYDRRHTEYERAATPPLIARPRDLAALVPVLKGQEPLLIDVDRASDILRAIELAHDYGIKLILSSAAEGWKVAPMIAAAKVPVLAGSLNNIPSSFGVLGQRHDNVAILRRAGVTVVLIGDAGEEDATPINTRNITQVAGTAVAFGLPWDEALRAVTQAPAVVFGLGDRTGVLRAGYDANVVVWSGDPFEFSTRAEHVYVRGREYTTPTREDLLTQRYKKLPPGY
jgi:imidazolonepropionase-like amidohydrolase